MPDTLQRELETYVGNLQLFFRRGIGAHAFALPDGSEGLLAGSTSALLILSTWVT